MNVPILRVPVTDVLAGVVVSRFFGAGASGFPERRVLRGDYAAAMWSHREEGNLTHATMD